MRCARAARRRSGGLNVRQLVTLASLVEKETARATNGSGAAVYRNRRSHMGMQADPTVIYALQKAGKYNGNLSRESFSSTRPQHLQMRAFLRTDRRAGKALCRRQRSRQTSTFVFRQQERRHASSRQRSTSTTATFRLAGGNFRRQRRNREPRSVSAHSIELLPGAQNSCASSIGSAQWAIRLVITTSCLPAGRRSGHRR